MKPTTTRLLLVLASCGMWPSAVAFCVSSPPTSRHLPRCSSAASSEWSVTDNWEDLSRENPQNSAPDSEDIFFQDIVGKAAYDLEQESGSEITTKPTPEDTWIKNMLDSIMVDSSNEQTQEEASHQADLFEEELSREIAMLVRCNESPEEMLTQQGRGMPTISKEERRDPAQLVQRIDEEGDDAVFLGCTDFLKQALTQVFEQHANEIGVLDAQGVAAWMAQSLQEPVGVHEKRVRTTISLHGTYGKGHLTLENFQDLYLKTIVGSGINGSKQDPWKTLSRRKGFIKGVWRDLANHGILSPNEQGHIQRFEEFRQSVEIQIDPHSVMLMDECELMDDAVEVSKGNTDREGTSSHERVQLASDKKTPIWINDGDFVFIDEESCIGCMQCTSAAPGSFRMVENGRARTYAQKSSPDVSAAVLTCPVNCMHFVSFDELKELETGRDVGDGRSDHRHFGNSPTKGYIGRIPLHVARRDSDANHRSSWYHYLKNKCQTSPRCPERGCYDCPKYSQPGESPHFQKRQKDATHERAIYFTQTGAADPYRTTAEL